jgi:hypothetical protein
MVYTSPFLAVTGPAPGPTVAEGNGINEAVPMKTVSALLMRQPRLPRSVPEQPRCGLPCDWV